MQNTRHHTFWSYTVTDTVTPERMADCWAIVCSAKSLGSSPLLKPIKAPSDSGTVTGLLVGQRRKRPPASKSFTLGGPKTTLHNPTNEKQNCVGTSCRTGERKGGTACGPPCTGHHMAEWCFWLISISGGKKWHGRKKNEPTVNGQFILLI